ncbi:30S ribosome-binding factor RbfA [Prosthecobacter vanneervenii]|uniref:Ribosome-binding factor A n=1 Tax=Prosthecobacter vanneervenii TaxID=48466 RepID=A0A7W8DJE3_9BACT|nr:30S ribosome-binding factor RbfA [Prosthecobacter vanneervenii]MBB5031940.1 ribosome-binding factor A [Prosthecobacter vanneervenii]
MSLRVEKVCELIRRELGTIIEKDFRIENCFVTIHEVSVTPDMRQCFVYVGVLGKPHQQEAAVEKLNKARGHLQRDLYKRVKLRCSPLLYFRLDKTVERGVPLLNIIDNLPPPLPDLPADEGQDGAQTSSAK